MEVKIVEDHALDFVLEYAPLHVLEVVVLVVVAAAELVLETVVLIVQGDVVVHALDVQDVLEVVVLLKELLEV